MPTKPAKPTTATVRDVVLHPPALCACGHRADSHAPARPSPCRHGLTMPRGEVVARAADPTITDDPRYGCKCVAFTPSHRVTPATPKPTTKRRVLIVASCRYDDKDPGFLWWSASINVVECRWPGDRRIAEALGFKTHEQLKGMDGAILTMDITAAFPPKDIGQ